MKSKPTVALLFVMTLVAPLAFAQAKLPRPQSPQAAPRSAATATEAAAVDAAPAEQRTTEDAASVEDASSVTKDTPSSGDETTSAAEDTASAAPEPPPAAAARDTRFLITILVAAVIFLIAVTGFVLQMRWMTRSILTALPRGDEGRHDRDKVLKEFAVLKNDTREQIASLRAAVDEVPAKVQQRVQNMLSQQKTPPAPSAPARPYETSEPSRPVQDASAQLLTIANRIVQQTPTTLDAFRASTRDLAMHVSPWPNAADGAPVAFIVENGGSCYAIPNVIKPARLPQDWFNRSEFGVNDEIQRIVSLPRLRRRGNDYEVTEPGVFVR